MGCVAHEISRLDELDSVFAPLRPDLALVSLDVEAGPELIAACRSRMGPKSSLVAITSAPCLLRAGEAVRRGASAVLARPTTFAQVAAVISGHSREDPRPMSLDRAIWEYLNQTIVEAGSISAAARRLRLDRTSLKRMLRKQPPAS